MKLTDEERTNSQVLMINKHLQQLRKQLTNSIAEQQAALHEVDEIIGTDKKVPVKSKKPTAKDYYNKFLQS